MKTKKEFLVETIMLLINSFLVNKREKRTMYLSFVDSQNHKDVVYYIHLLITIPGSTTVNIFATATKLLRLSELDSIEQYASATGGVLRSQVEDMVSELFSKHGNVEYLNDIQFYKIKFNGESDIGATFNLSMNGSNKIILKYL